LAPLAGAASPVASRNLASKIRCDSCGVSPPPVRSFPRPHTDRARAAIPPPKIAPTSAASSRTGLPRKSPSDPAQNVGTAPSSVLRSPWGVSSFSRIWSSLHRRNPTYTLPTFTHQNLRHHSISWLPQNLALWLALKKKLSSKRARRAPKTVLRLPDLDH